MSCNRCYQFCVAQRLGSPDDLSKTVGIVYAGIQDGILMQLKSDKPRFEPEIPFKEVAIGSPWPDIVDYRFECTSCGERFELEAETYHGRGGTWAPIRS